MEAFFSRKLALSVVAAALLLQDAAEAVQNVSLRRQLVTPHSFAEAEEADFSCFIAGQEFSGFEVAEFSAVPDGLSCQKMCEQHELCHFFSFIHGEGRCRLHSREPTQKKENPKALSGRKRCIWCRMDNFDFKGEVNNMDYGETAITTLEECQARCEAEPKCKAFLFQPKIKRCNFKIGNDPMKALMPQANYIAGPKSCKKHWCIMKNVDLPKGDLRSMKTKTAEDCQNACFDDEKCTHFSFQRQKQLCWLKSGDNIFNKKRSQDGVDSGTPECGMPEGCVSENTKYSGSVLGTYPKSEMPSFRRCKLECLLNDKCFFVHYNDTGCTLSGANATAVADPSSKAADMTC